MPRHYAESISIFQTDLLKVFATLGTTDFRSLELPALDGPIETTSQIEVVVES